MLRLVSADAAVLNGPGYLVTGDSYTVGRSKKCQFVINDHSVSRSHAEVSASEKSVCVKDLGSTNGTFVDGKRVDALNVMPGQKIWFGRVEFRLASDDHVSVSVDDLSAYSTSKSLGNKPTNEMPALKSLSEGQRRVLDLLLTGVQEKEVAAQLSLSLHTVHNHAKAIYKKLGVNSRAELLALFVT